MMDHDTCCEFYHERGKNPGKTQQCNLIGRSSLQLFGIRSHKPSNILAMLLLDYVDNVVNSYTTYKPAQCVDNRQGNQVVSPEDRSDLLLIDIGVHHDKICLHNLM